jgi:hypothetical protein
MTNNSTKIKKTRSITSRPNSLNAALPLTNWISNDNTDTNNKGNNKITELQTILQRESQNSKLYKQTKSVNNR